MVEEDNNSKEMEIGKATSEQEPKVDASGDIKGIFIVLGILAVVFALFFAGTEIYNHFTADEEIINIDDMHQENLAGNLDEDEGYMHNGYSFVYVDGLWWTESQRAGKLLKIPLHFGPKDVENVTIVGTLNHAKFNQGNIVYIASDPTVISGHYVLAMKELSSNIAQGSGKSTEGACTKEAAGCEDRKILSCEKSGGLPVIELALAEETKITLQDNCILVEGQDYGVVRAVDRLILQWYDMMN